MNVELSTEQPVASVIPLRHSVANADPMVLTEIYNSNNNMAIWQRQLANEIILAAENILMLKPNLQLSLITTSQLSATFYDALGERTEVIDSLIQDIAQLVEMFCCIFDLSHVGLRLTVLNTAMCPRFHVDNVPCRLVTTYRGAATEWLPDGSLNRTKLGAASHGIPDEQSGLFDSRTAVHQMSEGDVALLKGEMWEGNEGAGLVHRSPQIRESRPRLLLTLDYVENGLG